MEREQWSGIILSHEVRESSKRAGQKLGEVFVGLIASCNSEFYLLFWITIFRFSWFLFLSLSCAVFAVKELLSYNIIYFLLYITNFYQYLRWKHTQKELLNHNYLKNDFEYLNIPHIINISNITSIIAMTWLKENPQKTLT